MEESRSLQDAGHACKIAIMQLKECSWKEFSDQKSNFPFLQKLKFKELWNC